MEKHKKHAFKPRPLPPVLLADSGRWLISPEAQKKIAEMEKQNG